MFYLLLVIAFVITEIRIKDDIEKHRELGERQEILGGKIIIRKHYNEGAFLSFMEEKKEIVRTVSGICLVLLSLLFVLVLPKKGKVLLKLGLSLLMGGAISNVADRFSRGYVIDYFSFNYKKLKSVIFNLADMAIFLGSFLLLLYSFTSGIFKGSTDKALK